MSGYDERISKVRNLLEVKGLESIVIRRNPNLAWLMAARVHVPTTLDMACFDLLITRESVVAVTNAIEAPRLKSEELPSEVEIKIIQWWEGRDSHLPIGEKVGCDQPGQGRIDIGSSIEQLRQSLVEEDVARLREVSIDSAVALGNALKESFSTDREIDVTGRISNALWRNNLELVFIGVAGSDRVRKFRHPLPTNSVVGNRLVASICARRKGLIASVTRIVTFDDPAVNSYRNILEVEREILDATIVGQKFSDPIEAAIAAYPEFGFDEDEWSRHHQGGPTGYLPRDWTANRSSQQIIMENQPIGWNPTGNGWKAEDTWLATSRGVELLSVDSSWPTLEVGGRQRPDLLRR